MKITSVNNEIVKETAKLLQKKYRKETGLFLIEGKKCVQEALDSGIEVLRIFACESSVEVSSGIEIVETTESVLSKISDTKTPVPIIAVAKQKNCSIQELNGIKKIVLLDGIKDAGNLGTILRSAVAFNIDAIILYGDTIDLYNPKTIRSAVGNLWKIPIISINDINILKKNFKGYEFVATLPKNSKSVWLKDYIPKENVVMMFGSEAEGLSEELKSIATTNVTIEMSKMVESLNLGVSAGIIMYKLL